VRCCYQEQFFSTEKQATWQLHKPHKTTQLIKTHMIKPPKAHVFTVIKKENWHYKSSSFRGEELYRGETTT
jgi:hypothetical protein